MVIVFINLFSPQVNNEHEHISLLRKRDDVLCALDEATPYRGNKIANEERGLSEGVLKFCDKLKDIPLSRLPSCFYQFGADVCGLEKRSKGRPRIKVQVESQKRSADFSGSREIQSSGRKLVLKAKKTRPRRLHNFVENVCKNERVANKSQSIMASKTKHFVKSQDVIHKNDLQFLYVTC